LGHHRHDDVRAKRAARFHSVSRQDLGASCTEFVWVGKANVVSRFFLYLLLLLFSGTWEETARDVNSWVHIVNS
jgi:hypothetical protein